ncbi:MAG TPA: AzlD domain-containing protein [Deferrisomatales bacterium]|nr:AzlD domain-containing protein [Deferrisomatales bacterium]
MSSGAYLWLLGGMGAVTYLPRCVPLVALARRRLPDGVVEWLGLIAPAILAALVAPGLLVDPGTRSLDLTRPELWVAVPTLLCAWRTRSLGATVAAGMGLFWLAGKLGG